MKIRRSLILITVFLVMALVFSACQKNGGEEYKVAVSYPDGVVLTGENPATVKHGGSAVWNVKIPEGYVFKSCNGATYNQETGELKVENVTQKMYLEFLIEKYDYDLSETFVYVFHSDSSYDTTDVLPGSSVQSGTLITVNAGDTTRAFIGWSVGKSYADGGEIVSTSRKYSIRLTPDTVTDGVLSLYPNYVVVDTLTYDANGGSVNAASVNITNSKHYKATVSAGTVAVKYSADYLNYMECASAFYDDGTFVRDGYVLIEYNTRPDGTGVGYSIGSKVPMVTDSVPTTLYCIWAKDSNHADFTYTDVTYDYPFSKAETAPHWVENGVIITGYTGNDDRIVIPEKINGKYVTGIASGAISGKSVNSIVLSRRLIKVETGAITNCPSLETIYFSDGIYDMGNDALDAASYSSLKHLYVNATIAPRFVGADTGALSVKLSRLLSSQNENRIILISGSSSYQGFGTEYMEKLLSGDYRVVNFGTTRTTNGIMYLEAMGALAHEGDIIIYAPENSTYMFGETELYWKTLRDLENMINIYRYVDISNYSNVFGAFTDFNKSYRYAENQTSPRRYEDISVHGSLLDDSGEFKNPTTNKYGDYLYYKRSGVSSTYVDTYFITMNERIKSKNEGWWNDKESQNANKDYTDPNNITWASFTDPYFKDQMNRAIACAKSSGAKVYFGFCPVDSSAFVDGADQLDHLIAYDALIRDTYDFDGLLGSCLDYIYDHKYFYDCAFHLNDTGRTYRTYQMYLDLCEIIGESNPRGFLSAGVDFDGCSFEKNSSGEPLTPWS